MQKIDTSIEELSKEELIDLVYELNKSIKVQEDFLLNISHDLKSPINVVLSVLQCLKYLDRKDNKQDVINKRKEYYEIIKRNSQKMLKLINNLIDTTKLEGNYYKINKSNENIISVVEDTVESIEKYAEQKDIQLIFDTSDEECITAFDPECIDRVVMNLLSNAIKFSPIGSEIKIYTLVEEETVSISVTDEGPGIKKEDQEIIFNRFAQASQVSKGEHSGSGIGLDLVNCLVKLHNGRVELNSDVGKGSTFTIILPIEKIDDNNGKNILINKCKEEKIEIEFSDIYL